MQIKHFEEILRSESNNADFVAACQCSIEINTPESCPFGLGFDHITAAIAEKQFNRIYHKNIVVSSIIRPKGFETQMEAFFRYLPELICVAQRNGYGNDWNIITRPEISPESSRCIYDRIKTEVSMIPEASKVFLYSNGDALRLLSLTEDRLYVVGYHVFIQESTTHIDYKSVVKAYCAKHNLFDCLNIEGLLENLKYEDSWRADFQGQLVTLEDDDLKNFYNLYCTPTIGYSYFCSTILLGVLNSMSTNEWNCIENGRGGFEIVNSKVKQLVLKLGESQGFDKEKTQLTPNIFDFDVKGHYRHCCSGKVTWVKEHQRHGYAYRNCS